MDPCIGLVGLLLVIFWFVQLVDLLRRRDVEFPSPTDRIIWVLVIILLPVLGAILFFFMKPVKTFQPLPGSAELERDLKEMRQRMERPTDENE